MQLQHLNLLIRARQYANPEKFYCKSMRANADLYITFHESATHNCCSLLVHSDWWFEHWGIFILRHFKVSNKDIILLIRRKYQFLFSLQSLVAKPAIVDQLTW